jgi:hypothetical protein
MFNETRGSAPRIVEITRRGIPEPSGLTVAQKPSRSLPQDLADLRAEMDHLAKRLARERGTDGESTLRAEQISHAIQRLEWALDREEENFRPAN